MKGKFVGFYQTNGPTVAFSSGFTGWRIKGPAILRSGGLWLQMTIAFFRIQICNSVIKLLSMANWLLAFSVNNKNQRTIGPENAHLKPDLGVLSQHEMTLSDLEYSHTFIDFITCLHLQSFRSQAAIVSKPSDF